MTEAKSWLTLTWNLPERRVRARRRDTCKPSSSKTARGSGDHQRRGVVSSNQGKMPWRYASSSSPGLRSPPTATRPSGSAVSGSGKGLGLARMRGGIRESGRSRSPLVAGERVAALLALLDQDAAVVGVVLSRDDDVAQAVLGEHLVQRLG